MNQPPQGGYPPQPQGAYPQRPAQYPQQPAQYPQAPGQYPPGPQAYPPQYPGGAPYPGKRGPNKGLGVLKVLIGLCLAMSFGGGLMSVGHQGIAMAAIMGALMGVGLRWIVTGGANVAGKNIPLLPSLGVIALGGVIGAVGGGPVSGMWWGAQEEAAWSELTSDTTGYTDGWEWDFTYFEKIPAQFHRPEAQGAKKLSEVRYDIRENNLVDLRQHIYDIRINHPDDPNYKAALDAASGELKKKYDAVLEKLGKEAWQHTKAEFELDEKLRAAFKLVLTDLAGAPTSDIHVAFKNSSALDAPEGHEINLASEVRYVETRLGLEVPKPPKVIDPGAAFSPAYDSARRGAFIKVAGEAFQKVFDATLLTLKPLDNGEKRDGKFVLEVSSHIRRADSYFHYTSNTPGGGKILNGFLFAIEVDWELRLLGRDGSVMYEKKVSSVPGEQLSIMPQDSDPEWAVYSILMDSAYFNYSREVVGNFGIEPPAPKTQFAYSNYGVTGK